MTARGPEPFAARDTHFTVAVRVDGKRSHVEHHPDFDAAMDAGKQWCHNDEIAWVSLNARSVGPRGGRQSPQQTHILVRRGDEIIVREQAGRLDRVRRANGRSGHGTADLG